MVLVGCGGRDVSTVEDSLIGHWVEQDNDESHMYISSTELIYFSKGEEEKRLYEVIGVDEDEGEIGINIYIDGKEPLDLNDIVSFNDDKRMSMVMYSEALFGIYLSMGESKEAARNRAETKYIYADDKGKP